MKRASLGPALVVCIAGMSPSCGGTPQKAPAAARPVTPKPKVETPPSPTGKALERDDSLDSSATTSVVKGRPASGPFAKLQDLCAAWPQMAADDAGYDDPADVTPTTCEVIAKAALPDAVPPFEDLRVVEVSADRVAKELLMVRIAEAWYLVDAMKYTYEENRGGGNGKVQEIFFQDLVPGGGAELVLKIRADTWRMDHDDESDATYSSGDLSLQICHSATPGTLACAEIPYGDHGDGDGDPDGAYSVVFDLAVDGKGRVHVVDPDRADTGSAPAKLEGVFELSFP